MAFGGAVPEWIEAAMQSRSKIRELYPNSAVYQLDMSGDNLEALKHWADSIDANTELSRTISSYVTSTTGASTIASDTAKLKRAAETFTSLMSRANFSGLEKTEEFWILKQYNDDGKKEYTYYVLFLMPKTLYDQQIDGVLNKLPPADREIILPLVERAKKEIGNAY